MLICWRNMNDPFNEKFVCEVWSLETGKCREFRMHYCSKLDEVKKIFF